MSDLGQEMHDLCKQLFPICRSITGDGFRESLGMIARNLPEMEIFEVPTGTQCFDWNVPKEWNIRDAYIVTPDGKRICELHKSNLHVVGYSVPINKKLSLEALQQHLHSLPNKPDAIPYITSYYNENWGFCLTQNERDKLIAGEYQVVIDSELKDGSLTYGELILPGKTTKEVFLSTYLCHPSMANNELSGPVVTSFIAQWLRALKDRTYTYRIIFIPETIGSIAYLSRNHKQMKENVIAGFNLTCVGDDRAYSYLPSRYGNTLSDSVALHVLGHIAPDFKKYSFLDRGSDERQYCSPGIDLPVCSLMRSKYGAYPEYHTSVDDLSLVTPSGLLGGYQMVQKAIECLELNGTLRARFPCEPQLGKRGLHLTFGPGNNLHQQTRRLRNFLTYADGNLSNLEIAERIKVPLWELGEIIETLKKAELVETSTE